METVIFFRANSNGLLYQCLNRYRNLDLYW